MLIFINVLKVWTQPMRIQLESDMEYSSDIALNMNIQSLDALSITRKI